MYIKMDSFRTAREKIVRSKLAQLASLSKDATPKTNETDCGLTEAFMKNCEQRVDTDLENKSGDSLEVLATNHLGLDLNSYGPYESELKNLAKKLNRNKEAKPDNVFVFRMQVPNIKFQMNSGSFVTNTGYVSELDCCFRYGAFFPKDNPNMQIMELFIDMSQVGKDARLPDFLQTSAKIGIVNQSNGSEETVGSEEGLFHLPKYREFGWFEMASVPINWPEILNNDRFSIHDDTVAVTFTISVYKSMVPNKKDERVIGQTNKDTESTWSDSSDTEDDADDTSLTGVCPTIMSDSFCFPLSEFNMCDNNPVICASDEWPVEFLGHSIKAVLAFGFDSTLDIFLDYFHGIPGTLPEIVCFKCRVCLIHPTDKKKMAVVGENDHVFNVNDEEASYWLNNHVCSVNTRLILDQNFVVDNAVLLRFDFYPLD